MTMHSCIHEWGSGHECIHECMNDVINVHELRQIVRGLKSKKAVGNDGIPSEVYKFASERLLTIMSIFFPVYAFW